MMHVLKKKLEFLNKSSKYFEELINFKNVKYVKINNVVLPT